MHKGSEETVSVTLRNRPLTSSLRLSVHKDGGWDGKAQSVMTISGTEVPWRGETGTEDSGPLWERLKGVRSDSTVTEGREQYYNITTKRSGQTETRESRENTIKRCNRGK